MKCFLISILFIIISVLYAYIYRTDTVTFYNYVFRQNAFINNQEISKHWTELTSIMYQHSYFIETGTNQIPDKMNDIYKYFNAADITDIAEITEIAEIGFNGGHSCVVLLILFPNAKITIFDICEHSYVNSCFDYLDNLFPDRLTLIPGDSTKTLPTHTQKYNLIHIDGGHFDDIPKQDLENTYNNLIDNQGYIIYDDTYYEHSLMLNMFLSHCRNAFKIFIKKYNVEIKHICNGSTICFVNKTYL